VNPRSLRTSFGSMRPLVIFLLVMVVPLSTSKFLLLHIFTDFFTCGLRFPCDPMLIAILDKFSVKIHHLSPNSFLELSKFFWIMKTFRCNFSADVFARLFELVIAGNYQTQRWPIPRIALQLLYFQHTPTKYATRAHTYLDCALL
jgi:hypothetical protein